MKKILFYLIFFIIVVLISTFNLSSSREINEEEVVTEEEIAREKQIFINICEEIGYVPTEEEINKRIEDYKAVQISIAKSNAEGTDVRTAFKASLIGCIIAVVTALLVMLSMLGRRYYL